MFCPSLNFYKFTIKNLLKLFNFISTLALKSPNINHIPRTDLITKRLLQSQVFCLRPLDILYFMQQLYIPIQQYFSRQYFVEFDFRVIFCFVFKYSAERDYLIFK